MVVLNLNAKSTTRKKLYELSKKIKNKKICKAAISKFNKGMLKSYIVRNGKRHGGKVKRTKAKSKPRPKAKPKPRPKTRANSRPKRTTRAPKYYGRK